MDLSKPICNFCEKSFSSKKNLSKHIRYVHKISNSVSTSFFICKENVCSEKYISSKQHLSKVHNFHFVSSELEFENMGEFNTWKSSYEETDSSNLSKSTGIKLLKNGYKKYFFCCNRSGIAKLKKNTDRISQGSCKLGFNCAATIILTEKPNGKIDCVLYPDHYGHPKEIGTLNLTKGEKDQIALKLSQKIDEDNIMKEIGDDYI